MEKNGKGLELSATDFQTAPFQNMKGQTLTLSILNTERTVTHPGEAYVSTVSTMTKSVNWRIERWDHDTE